MYVAVAALIPLDHAARGLALLRGQINASVPTLT